MSLHDYFLPDSVVELGGRARAEVLREMVDTLSKSSDIADPRAFHRAVVEREKLVSTGIGFGIAIPHAKIPDIRRFVVGLGRSRAGIDYPSIDDEPVHIVVMIGGPDGRQSEYLKLLASVQRFLKSERDAILEAADIDEIRARIEAF